MAVGIQSGRLGDRLRHARESRGASTEKASEQASIPIRYIQMFEEGHHPLVADPAYLTHFVRRYAAYLGLDVWQASRDFIAETDPETALSRAPTQ
jgi:cytoskeleton protein RodZ